MGNLFTPLLNTLGTIFSPVHFVFQYVFYQPVFNILMLVYAGVHNFALSIVILTLLIRSAMIPLTRRQLRSSKVMQELAPQLNELKAQYKNDPQGLMAAQQALYKENGVSLYGGCLPLLIQLPFLYALYYSFFTVLNPQNVTQTIHGHTVTVAETIGHHLGRINADIYPFLPHLTTLPATQFFWTSLAHPDPLHILPALAGILTFVQLRMSLPVRSKTQARAASAGPDPSQSMQIMQYIMPIITFTIGLNFPAGLALYWCITTGFSAVQQYFISGWGSLFVGVPGMERFVPPPKDTTPTTTSALTKRTLTPTTSTRSDRSSSTGSAETAPPQEGGIFASLKRAFANATAQASAQAAAAQRAAEEAAAARQREQDEQRAARQRAANEADGANGANGTGGANKNARRQRPSKGGPTLIKPPTAVSATPSEAPSVSAPLTEERPEVALARDAKSGSNGKTILPEKAIARDAAGAPKAGGAKRAANGVSVPKGAGSNGSNGANGANGAIGAKGSNGANGSRAAASAKNNQPQRPRSNGAASRPKGGR